MADIQAWLRGRKNLVATNRKYQYSTQIIETEEWAALLDCVEALAEIVQECATNLDCNHPSDEDEDCGDLDDCIGCTITQIANMALDKFTGGGK